MYHIQQLILIKKDGYIYFDDTESYLYRIKKNNILSIINDATSNVVKDFYYSNYDDLIYTKYYKGSGLSKFLKLSEMGTKPKFKKIWNYNFIFAKIYLLLKNLKYRVFGK